VKLGAYAIATGLPILGLAIFGMGMPSPWPMYVVGLTLLSFGVARLVWSGWRGSESSWLVAAPAAAILTWTLYELVRQEVPLYGIGILGEMTAPSLSGATAVGILVIGWVSRGRSRGIRER
jgi:membrane protease YdiL (CAAX protease family)